MVDIIKLGAKCQMVLPNKIRKALGLGRGDEMNVKTSGNSIVLIPKPKNYADRLSGLHSEIWRETNPEDYVGEQRESWEE